LTCLFTLSSRFSRKSSRLASVVFIQTYIAITQLILGSISTSTLEQNGLYGLPLLCVKYYHLNWSLYSYIFLQRQDNGAVGYDELPKNSNHFMYAQSIKKTPAATIHLAAPDDNPSEILQLLQGIQAIVSSAAAPPPPAYPNHFYPHPNYTAPTGPLPLYHTGQYGGYQPQYLAPPNSAPPYQPTIDMNPRLSPPPAVLASIDDWYGFSNPDEEDKVALKSLHFQVGDRLKDVPEEDWKAAGFVRLSWKRMLRIDERYRDSQHRQAI
jgi:hypothetical protein